MMDVKAHIIELLDEYGWTKYRLAKESNLSPSTLRNLFIKNHDPSLATLDAICKGFGISLAEFFADGADFPSEQRKLITQYNSLDDKQRKIIQELIESWK